MFPLLQLILSSVLNLILETIKLFKISKKYSKHVIIDNIIKRKKKSKRVLRTIYLKKNMII